MSDELVSWLKRLEREIERLKEFDVPVFHKYLSPKTSTSWDGDAHSTTAKTKIDLSAVFGVPEGISAVLIRILAADSGSAAAAAGNCWFEVAPTSGAGLQVGGIRLAGVPNDVFREATFPCPCNADGDIYFQCNASGANTLDVYIQLWGYWK